MINDIRDYSIARKSIDPRAKTLGNAFTSVHGNKKPSGDKHELSWSNVIADSVFTLDTGEYAEFDITWSVTAQTYEDFGVTTAVRVAPFINDRILWGAADAYENRYKWGPGTAWNGGGASAQIPTDSSVPREISHWNTFGSGPTHRSQDALNGSCSISVANGSFNVGLIAFSSQINDGNVYDRWYFLNPVVIARRITR